MDEQRPLRAARIKLLRESGAPTISREERDTIHWRLMQEPEVIAGFKEGDLIYQDYLDRARAKSEGE